MTSQPDSICKGYVASKGKTIWVQWCGKETSSFILLPQHLAVVPKQDANISQ